MQTTNPDALATKRMSISETPLPMAMEGWIRPSSLAAFTRQKQLEIKAVTVKPHK
jgi:hypothetical protein